MPIANIALEELALWVVNEKPQIEEIAQRLKHLTEKFSMDTLEKFLRQITWIFEK